MHLLTWLPYMKIVTKLDYHNVETIPVPSGEAEEYSALTISNMEYKQNNFALIIKN